MHRIHRQILELELPREQGAYAMQQRAALVFQEQVLPRLDEMFTRIAPADRYVRIERLELDLGNITEAGWERDFVEKCVATISAQIAKAAYTANNDPASDAHGANEQSLSTFLFFLENGFFRWEDKLLTLKDVEIKFIENRILEDSVCQSEIRRTLTENPAALPRLIQQFSPEFSAQVIAAALDLPDDWFPQALRMYASQTGRAISRQERIVLARFIMEAGPDLPRTAPPTPHLLAQIFLGENIPQAAPKTTKATVQPDAPVENRPPKPSQTAPKPQTSKRNAALANGIPVENAGLVLLAPYLPHLFKNTGMLPPSSLISHPSSLYLLHYLATRQESAEEPQLLLPKILCGWPLDEPVPLDVTLSDETKQEAEKLLSAVIEHWGVLKNSSPDGLRTAFLMREGLLYREEASRSWLLRIERLGQDLLLDRLPWSISVIKLGWMEEMVRVEW